MDNFNYKKFLAEGKLHEEVEALSQEEVMDMAGMVADAFTEESADRGDYLKYSPSNVEGMHFELDTDVTEMTPEDLDTRGVGEGWGGSFHIKALDNGYEIRNSEKGGLVATMDVEGFKMLSADESRAEMGMEKGPVYPEDKHLFTPDEFEDRMEEGEMLDEGIIDAIKDKIVAKVDKIKSKFSAEEIAKMKAVAEKAIGKSAEEVTMADFTMDNIKKVGKAISALNEEEQIEEGLGEKIQGLGAGLGLPAMFVGGHMAMASAAGGVEAFIAGAIALVVGLIGGAIVKSMDEAQEAPKSNKMKKSELKEMIRAAMLAEAEKDEEVADEIELEDTEEVDVEMDADMEGDSEVDGIDVKQDADAELGGVKGDVQDNLEAALEAAKKLGDDKLVDQIGNSLTFFTRQHVVKESDMIKDEAEMGLEEAKENLNESIEFPMWNKIK